MVSHALQAGKRYKMYRKTRQQCTISTSVQIL